MKPKVFSFSSPTVHGLPRALTLALLAMLVVGVVSLIVMVGMAVVVVSVSVSAVAALWFAVRGKLKLGSDKTAPPEATPRSEWSSGRVHEVEVEVLPLGESKEG